MPATSILSTYEDIAVDIIGDVHGNSEALCDLLSNHGYTRHNGVWSHHNRKAVFVGDLIDHGPDARAVLKIVSSMQLHGEALCVMGNHEFNALRLYSNVGPKSPSFALSERQQEAHEPTVQQIVHSHAEEWKHWLDWMSRLPLWLDFGDFRVIHACWDQAAIERINSPELNPTRLHQIFADPISLCDVDLLLNGPKVQAPVTDNRPVRVKWWLPPNELTSFGKASVDPLPAEWSDLPIPHPVAVGEYFAGSPLVIVGHYNQKVNNVAKFAGNVACVDYCNPNSGIGLLSLSTDE